MAHDSEQLDKLRAKHTEYTRLEPDRKWARAVRDGMLTDPAERKEFLVKGESEPEKDFEARTKLLEYSAESPKIINRVLGTVFKRTPRREELGPLEDWAMAVTREGKPIGDLSKRASDSALWGRWSLALLDRRAVTADAPTVLTQADAEAQGIDKPFMVLYEPEQIFDWRIDADGKLSYVRLCTQHGLQEGGFVLTEYREVWADKIRLWRLEERDKEPVLSAPEDTPLENFAAAGRLPVAVAQFDRIDAMRARSPLTEALAAEKKAMRLESDILWDIYIAGHPWLMLWIRDTLSAVGVGVTKYLKLDPGDSDRNKEEAQWLEINGAALELAMRERDAAKAEVFNKIGVSGSAVRKEGEAATANSGAQVAFQFEVDEGNTLASVADMAERFERDVLTIAAIDTGQEPAGILVAYNKEDFGLQSPERMLAKTTQARMIYGAAHPVTIELMNRAARVLVPNKDEKWYGEVDAANLKGAQEPEVPGFNEGDE